MTNIMMKVYFGIEKINCTINIKEFVLHIL
jgi:hypothetical protein